MKIISKDKLYDVGKGNWEENVTRSKVTSSETYLNINHINILILLYLYVS